MIDVSKQDRTLSKEVFEGMIRRYVNFVKSGREPKYVTLLANGQEYVTLAKFKEMYGRWNQFIATEGRSPNNISILVKIYLSDKTNFTKAFAKAIGRKFNTFTEGYGGIKLRGYKMYYNDIYNQNQALLRLAGKLGLNCADITQLLYQLGKDLGYSVRYVHIRCKSGTGHIQLDIKGKEFGNNWFRVDGALALKSGGKIGDLWCSDGKIIGYDDQWLKSDDGIT